MKFLQRLFGSSLGKKYLMALTGGGLLLFATGHMVGNLQFFLGPEPLNAYAYFLQHTPELLWAARLGLLAMVGVHIWSATLLTLENRAARPVAYDQATLVAASFASRTMIYSGLIIGAFVVFHLLHYTVKLPAVNLTGGDFHVLLDDKQRQDVFAMMVHGFSQPWVAAFYVFAVSLLSLHLGHGIGALFQSLGLKNKTWGTVIDRLGVVMAWVLLLGYLSIPAAVLLGYGKEVLH